jgi:hypothetical protein
MKSLIVALLLLCISLNNFSQDKIDQSLEELKRGSGKKNNDDNSSSSSSSSSSGDNVIAEVLIKAFLYITYYSFIGNYAEEEHLQSNLTPYPYYNHSSGNFESDDSVAPFYKVMRLDMEDKILVNPQNLFGNHLKAKFRPFQYFYLQGDYYQLLEYKTFKHKYSNLALFNLLFGYDRVRLEKFNLGWTLGANFIANDVQRAGISFGLNAEAFVFKSYSIYSSVNWGRINGFPVNEFEIGARYHTKNHFVTMAYERLRIATPIYDFAAVGCGIYF